MDNKLEVVKENIIPVLQELKKQCLLAGVPFFASIAAGDIVDPETKEETTRYISEIITPVVVNTKLTDDKITKMLNIMNGFDVVDPNIKFEVNF